MSPNVNWFAFLATVCVSVISSAAEPTAPKPPELKVLERLVGTWNSESVSRVAVWTPVEARAKGVLTREWVLDGRFVQEKSKQSDGDAIVMFSFDAEKKVYRWWLFNSHGHSMETQGQWDETTHTFMFTSDVGGLKNSSTIRFIDEDTHKWTAVVKDAQGKVFYDGEGKCTRRK
jgi:hypothetical protein